MREKSCDTVEKGGFPRAVGTNEADEFSGLNLQIDPIQCLNPEEPLRQILDSEEGLILCHRPDPSLSKAETLPFGFVIRWKRCSIPSGK